jgi:tetratricopeptide (TPR) repeat protein
MPFAVAQDSDLADTSSQMAVLIQEHHYSDAVALGKKSLADAQLLPVSDPRRLTLVKQLTDAEWKNNEVAAAAELLRQTIAELEKTGINGVEAADLRMLLALQISYLGRSAEAEEMAQRAMKVLDDNLSEDDLRVANGLLTLAIIEHGTYKTLDELPLLKRALRILSKAPTSSSAPLLKLVLLQLATFYDRAGDFHRASDYRMQATTVRMSGITSDEPADLAERGLAALKRGDFSVAADVYRQTLKLARAQFGETSPLTLGAKQWLAMAYLALHDRKAAKPLMLDMLTTVYGEYLQSFPLMNDQERLEFISTSELRLGLFCSYVDEFHDADPSLTEEMFDLALWSKGSILLSARSAQERLRLTHDPTLRRLRAELETAQKRYFEASASQPAADVYGRKTELLAVERKIAAQLGEKDGPRIRWQDVRGLLRAGDVAVEVLRFFHTDGRQSSATTYYAALVLRAEWPSPRYVLLGNNDEIEHEEATQYAIYATATIYVPPQETFGLTGPIFCTKWSVSVTPC